MEATYYIANVGLEWELQQAHIPNLDQSFSRIERKLLELPKLWAQPEDLIYPATPRAGMVIDSLAPSRMIEKFAQKHRLLYKIHDWDLIKKIASKAFAHELSPLPGSRILHDEGDLERWMKEIKGPVVFKAFYGSAGRGHRFKTKDLKFPLLAEPWVERELDFSTQWFVGEQIEYLGATIQQIDERGRYRGNLVGHDIWGADYKELLDQHIAFVHEVLKNLPGFFGYIGFDAMVYGNGQLQPLLEINPRKTMGWVALKLFSLFPGSSNLKLEYEKGEISYVVG